MQRGASHQFMWTSGAWQCQKCERLTHRTASRVANSRCSAMPGPLSRCVELANKLGHQLWAGEVGRTGLPMLVCMRCGAFAMPKPLLLMRACAQRCANAAAKKVRVRLLDGKHPEDGRAVGGYGWRSRLRLSSVPRAGARRRMERWGTAVLVSLSPLGKAAKSNGVARVASKPLITK